MISGYFNNEILDDLLEFWRSTLVKSNAFVSFEKQSKKPFKKLPRLDHDVVEPIFEYFPFAFTTNEDLLKMGYGVIDLKEDTIIDTVLHCTASESYDCYALNLLTQDEETIQTFHSNVIKKLQKTIFEKHRQKLLRSYWELLT